MFQAEKVVNEGKKAFPVSVNFSRASLTGPGFVKRLVDISEKYTISPNYLEIEITESMRDAKDFELKELIEELRRCLLYTSAPEPTDGPAARYCSHRCLVALARL